MGQLRTANKRHNRAIRLAQSRKTPIAAKPVVATEPAKVAS